MIRLVLGLGNPGPRYRGTRHNVGFGLVERVAQELGVRFFRWQEGLLAVAQHPAGGEIYLAKPHTYMNLSGGWAAQLVRAKHLEPGEVLVCFDDIDLSLGRVRLRRKGSSGGHLGMQSVIDSMGTQHIPRLRLGVGPVPEGEDPAEFVLQHFHPSESAVLEEGMQRGAKALWSALTDLEAAMTQFNRRVD